MCQKQMKVFPSLAAPCGLILLFSASGAISAVTVQIVADNDFAVYAGNDSSISRAIYQNEVIWNSQLAAASSFSFDLEPGETVFYLLAMGGGGDENISGKINGINIVKIFQDDPTTVSRSNPIETFLSSYNTGTVSNGSYTPTLSSVQAALAEAIWGAPETVTGATVVNGNPEAIIEGQHVGFNVPSSQAVFFRFDTESVGVPEPNAAAMTGLVTLLAAARRRRD